MANNDTQATVKAINEIYSGLSKLTHDELRNKFHEICSHVSERTASLDDVLVDVFAIVKETMRRFNDNYSISVRVTPEDIALADVCDFVKINHDNGTAQYLSFWSVLGNNFRWNMVPYDEQLQGGIEIHNKRIVQMATGEGKTLAVVAPVILNAIEGKSVHVMTVNEYLSKRDFEMTRPIYAFLGFSVGCIEGKSHRSRLRKEAYACDITFGTVSGFLFDYLYDHTSMDVSECVQGKLGFAIVDEADSVMIDEADTSHILSGGMQDSRSDENLYKKYMPLIKELTESSTLDLYKVDILRQEATLTEKGKVWLAQKCNDEMLFNDDLHVQNIKSIEEDCELTEAQKKGRVFAEHNAHLEQLKIQNVLHQLLRAFTVFEKDVDYIVTESKIIIIDPNTGRLKPSHVWRFGLHEAIMVKEKLSPKLGLDMLVGIISIKNYLLLYDKLSGMTGTAIAVENEWHNVYGLEVAIIPTHKPIVRKDLPLRVFAQKSQALAAMAQEVVRLHEMKRPVLVGVNSIRQSEKIMALLHKDYGLDPQLLNAKTLGREAAIIARAGKLGCITVATNVAGRGTDIKPDDDALNAGGLAVIGCGIAYSQRIDQQLIGRSGRQGNPGSSQFFVSCEDKIVGYLSSQDKTTLEKLARQADVGNGEINNNSAVELFMLAQRNKENEDREEREEVTKRDDIINPYRQSLYSIRMHLLLRASEAIENGFKLFGLLRNESFWLQYEKRKREIAVKAIPIVKKALNGMWSADAFYPIPLMANGKAFTVMCDFREAVATKGKSIVSEFERQILLTTINKLWSRFINEINSSFITANEYETIYQNMFVLTQKELQQILLSVILLVNESEEKDDMDRNSSDRILFSNTACDLVGMEEPCPCKSGKPYWQCHGRLRVGS